MNDCLFCDPNDLTNEALLENSENFKLILDLFPVSFGHIIVIPTRHVESIDELNSKEMKELRNSISEAKTIAKKKNFVNKQYSNISKHKNRSKKMIESLKNRKSNIQGFNIGINEGKAAGQTIKHLHIHVIPRYEGDVEDPEGGVRNVIPERGSYSDPKESL